MPEPPTVGEIQRATRIIEQEPQITAKEAIERARGITYRVYGEDSLFVSS